MPQKNQSFYILGKNTNGKIFRPSDWQQRLYASIVYANESIKEHIHIVMKDNQSILLVDGQLQNFEAVYKFIIDFIQSNQLVWEPL